MLVKVKGKKLVKGQWRKSKPVISFHPDKVYEIDDDCFDALRMDRVDTPKAEAPKVEPEPAPPVEVKEAVIPTRTIKRTVKKKEE